MASSVALGFAKGAAECLGLSDHEPRLVDEGRSRCDRADGVGVVTCDNEVGAAPGSTRRKALT